MHPVCICILEMQPEHALDMFLHCHLQDDSVFVVLICVVA